MSTEDAVLIVEIGGCPYGLPLKAVERVLPMAYVLPVPDSGEGLLGMLNLHGDVLPVVDPRRRLGLSTPNIASDHRLIVVCPVDRTAERFLMWVDQVDEVFEGELTVVPAGDTNPLVPHVLRRGDQMVPILAPSAFEPRRRAR